MTHFYKTLFSALFFGSLLVACNKGFLDQTPVDRVPKDQVWKDPALATAFVNEIYNGLGQGGFEEQMLASVSDEAVFTHTGRNINTINEGSLNATNVGWESDTYKYGTMYNRIRACNITLQELSNPENMLDNNTKALLMGQAYFLRAYFYHQLVRYYGGVPLITKVYDLDEDYSAARNSFEECINFIVNDCDSAALLLKGQTMDNGRATRVAALALKSRTLLYAASDLHDKAKISAVWAAGATDQLVYSGGSQKDRWELAKQAALAVIQEGGGGYKLDLTAPVADSIGTLNYISISMGGGSTAPGVDASAASDLLFARYFIADKDESGEYIGKYNGPNGYHNWSGNTPVGLLVDDYRMKDGTPFSWSNPDQKAHPYTNRDPRFYATIMYDGAGWKPRNLVSGDVDPANQIQTGFYDLASGGKTITVAGLDTRSSSIEDWNGSRTGYYMRKFIDPNPKIKDASDKQFIPWPFFRYTEAVLNYAEACIETGDEATAKTWLNKIRFRAGMPAITSSGAALLAEYRNERRIELAYEEHRYHDARRWLIAPQTLGRKLTFISISGKFKSGKTMSAPYHHDETIYNYTYTPFVDNAHENRTWDNKMYYRPFSRDELNKNSKLEQNPGYTKS
ncbi:carbohydrate-binding protein SusD [Niabella ginsenosidivorans]|uniref:Carbohydrate-binding protein SusD n=1 Tax=Niabella ginsenosidivorans TaxID=1176587 RepID=A0A1A9I6D0_9BACT|nr:RagB/SusD family nutrient uptake outer membrane protein [Niabella ginsenosidivorans]ANH83247.1 carbohydrate-binding protein SusD [Niabella ginsenosidivorans]